MQQNLHKPGARLQQMLAIIEYEQDVQVAQVMGDGVGQRVSGVLVGTRQDLRHRLWQEVGTPRWGKLDPPHAVLETLHCLCGHLEGQAGLT